MNEAPTPRSTSESEPATIHDYKADIEATIEQAQAVAPEQKLELMESFLDSMYADVEQGLVKNKAGEISDPEDMTLRLSTLMSELSDTDEDSDPFLLIPSDGGLRATVKAYLSEEATSTALTKAIEGRTYSKTIESLPRADVRMHEVGNQTLKAAGVTTEAAVSSYDHLFDLNNEGNASVESAAVYNDEAAEAIRMSRERTQADAQDAAIKYAAQRRAGIQ